MSKVTGSDHNDMDSLTCNLELYIGALAPTELEYVLNTLTWQRFALSRVLLVFKQNHLYTMQKNCRSDSEQNKDAIVS